MFVIGMSFSANGTKLRATLTCHASTNLAGFGNNSVLGLRSPEGRHHLKGSHLENMVERVSNESQPLPVISIL